jgi:hypothetical protein
VPFTPFGLGDVGSAAQPSFADVDGDGDLDAFVGADDEGYVHHTFFFENTGTAGAPAFAPPAANPFGLTSHGAPWNPPVLVDVDGDADLDAFLHFSFLFFANTATTLDPVFAPPLADGGP